MNRKLVIALSFVFVILACHKDRSSVGPATNTASHSQTKSHYAAKGNDSTANSAFITMDDANQMINSYLYSIANDSNNTSQTPDIHSFSINADSLRAYLANPQITNVKLFFAHTMDYINAGNFGQYAGYQSGAITIILAAYDAKGNYVYYLQGGVAGGQAATGGATNYVLDHCVPCPANCPQGVAGGDFLQ